MAQVKNATIKMDDRMEFIHTHVVIYSAGSIRYKKYRKREIFATSIMYKNYNAGGKR